MAIAVVSDFSHKEGEGEGRRQSDVQRGKRRDSPIDPWRNVFSHVNREQADFLVAFPALSSITYMIH